MVREMEAIDLEDDSMDVMGDNCTQYLELKDKIFSRFVDGSSLISDREKLRVRNGLSILNIAGACNIPHLIFDLFSVTNNNHPFFSSSVYMRPTGL